MEIYSNEFITLHFLSNDKLMEATWLPDTSRMTDKQYKECFIVIAQLTKEFRPNKVIVDSTKMDFSIHPTLQEWTDNVIHPVMMAVGLKKMAFIMSENFTVQIGIEQTIEEIENPFLIVRYFNNISEAKTWVLSNN